MEQEEFDRTVDLMTPKFRRRSDFRFRDERKKHPRGVWWKICSVAAGLALIVTAGLYTQASASAETIAMQSIEKFNAANTYKIDFVLYGVILDDKGFSPVPGGNAISGTLYLMNDNGVEKSCLDYKTPDNIREVYDGKNYTRYKGGKLDKRANSGPLNLLELFKMDSASDFLKNCRTTDEGNYIEIQHSKGEVTMYGRFSKGSKKLLEAFVKVKDDMLLKTEHIEYDVEIPENMFE